MKFWHWLLDKHDWKETDSKFYGPTRSFTKGFDMEEILKLHHGFTRIYYKCTECGATKYEDILGDDRKD